MGKRACFPVRCEPSERDRIASAAKARRQSMNGFVLNAALEAAGEGELGAKAPSEAISGLEKLGYPLGDAKRAVRGFCQRTPGANAQEILSGVLRSKGEALCSQSSGTSR